METKEEIMNAGPADPNDLDSIQQWYADMYAADESKEKIVNAEMTSAERLEWYESLKRDEVKTQGGVKKNMSEEDVDRVNGPREGYVEEIGSYDPILKKYRASYRKVEE